MFHARWLAAVDRGAQQSELVAICFDHCHRMVFGAARRITGSVCEAEDITQTVFEALARRLDDIREPARIPGFLKRCAVRTAVRQVQRARWRREQVLLVFADRSDMSTTEVTGHRVRRALERLDPQACAAVVLKHVERHTHAEVANLLGVSLATARRWLARGERELRQQLSRHGE